MSGSSHLGFRVRYAADNLFYFCHSDTWAGARWLIVQRHNRAFGFTGLLVQRVHALDDVPITRSVLEKMGYVLARGDSKAEICSCSLCHGGKDDQKA